jgi:hypothetical protein
LLGAGYPGHPDRAIVGPADDPIAIRGKPCRIDRPPMATQDQQLGP